MTIDERPLVTFGLFAYNQEKYIRDAVEGAFAQTYQPLEIILSDDCSSDRTFEIMQEMAAEYKGPHKVLLRRSDSNQGLIAHVNSVALVASSDFLVAASGDDVSFSYRTATVMNAFLGDRKTMAVFSRVAESLPVQNVGKNDSVFMQIDLFEMALNAGGVGTGAAYAYRRECFFWPTAIPNNISSEDRILPFRAGLLGHVYLCDQELVMKREVHSSLSKRLANSKKLARDLPSHWKMLSALLLIARKDAKLGFFRFTFIRYVFFIVEIRQRIMNMDRRKNYYVLRTFRSILYLPFRIAKKSIKIKKQTFNK